jgi:hypothetical protein
VTNTCKTLSSSRASFFFIFLIKPAADETNASVILSLALFSDTSLPVLASPMSSLSAGTLHPTMRWMGVADLNKRF